ncbi:hypothetical protein FOMPIDRAFT_1015371 [Fomitopsis schrenkii]|uniref:Hydrophobin n=1 Tax=Fomitopsis schrenkii TaxID=2126942 RepID=S8FVN1_FOMSC|nr:hypothetical protein FOMPIDRAFT_1015371 [Fomitopsis schrenkii]
MRSTIITTALALAYGITAAAAIAAPAPASVDSSLHAQCGTAGDSCGPGELAPCCDGFICVANLPYPPVPGERRFLMWPNLGSGGGGHKMCYASTILDVCWVIVDAK